MIKKLASVLIATSLITPMLANADLVINNRTDTNSTSIIAPYGCSAQFLKGYGITKANSQNRIPQFTIEKIACYWHPNDCAADVYMNDSCSGQKIATVTLSTTRGVYKVDMTPGSKYKITSENPWSITIDPA